MTSKSNSLRRRYAVLAMSITIAASLILLAGCASTEGGPLAMAQKVHSMTPCGMMMGAMMGDGHSGHADAGAHHEVESSIDQKPESSEESHNLQSHPSVFE